MIKHAATPVSTADRIGVSFEELAGPRLARTARTCDLARAGKRPRRRRRGTEHGDPGQGGRRRRGIGDGQGVAELLAKAAIAILDLPTSAGAEVASGLGGTFHPVDVMDEESVEQALATPRSARRDPHRGQHRGWRHRDAHARQERSAPLDEFRRVIELNLIGSFNLNRLQALRMSKNEPEDGERGVIIDTASIAAFEGQIGQVAYTAAKAGIAGMMLTMARDLGSLGIRSVAIAPSLFSTGITEGIPDEFADMLTKDAAFPKRMGRPEEYGRLVVAIVETPMLNGSTIRLDAGQRFAPK